MRRLLVKLRQLFRRKPKCVKQYVFGVDYAGSCSKGYQYGISGYIGKDNFIHLTGVSLDVD